MSRHQAFARLRFATRSSGEALPSWGRGVEGLASFERIRQIRPCCAPSRQSIRSFGVKIKLNPVRSVLAGKSVVLIDDSIVRGTTSRKIVQMVRDAGAREVHVRISSPPTTGPCYYGIDTPLKSELIASSHSVEEIGRFIEADSLGYLSHEGLLAAVSDPEGRRHCTACFSGRYPVAVSVLDESQLRLFEKARA